MRLSFFSRRLNTDSRLRLKTESPYTPAAAAIRIEGVTPLTWAFIHPNIRIASALCSRSLYSKKTRLTAKKMTTITMSNTRSIMTVA